MSAKPHRRRVPPETVKERGLMPWWNFCFVERGEILACWLCGRPASYATDDDPPMPWCERHARDF
jgi:hypothetical protein